MQAKLAQLLLSYQPARRAKGSSAQADRTVFAAENNTQIGEIFRRGTFSRYAMWSQSLVIQSPTRGVVMIGKRLAFYRNLR